MTIALGLIAVALIGFALGYFCGITAGYRIGRDDPALTGDAP